MGRPDLVEKYEKKARDDCRRGIRRGRDRSGRLTNTQSQVLQKHPVYAAMVEAMDEAVGIVLSNWKTRASPTTRS